MTSRIKLIQIINDSCEQLKVEYLKTAAKYSDMKSPPNPPKKKNRLDGFTAPTKVVKKQKVLQNYSFGAAAPVTTTNKYQTLSLETTRCRLRTTQQCQLPPKKIPHSSKIRRKSQPNHARNQQKIAQDQFEAVWGIFAHLCVNS
ncbi:hypothetical protein TNCV_2508971 [Trichonephila clavipes]|nr:hypothetical protein TNCV_2508971 [Trichonephila clavipes]